jgi:single-strand DNA-binding protein
MEMLIIAGTVGKDAVLRRTQNDDAVLSFSVAVDQGKDKNGNKRDTRWYDASLWGKRAESLQSYITKGTKLTLQGRPTAREHQGKVYMGIAVNDLTFMGGASQRDTSQQDQGGYQDFGGSAYGATTGGYSDMDQEIPFAPEWRI